MAWNTTPDINSPNMTPLLKAARQANVDCWCGVKLTTEKLDAHSHVSTWREGVQGVFVIGYVAAFCESCGEWEEVIRATASIDENRWTIDSDE